MNPHALALLNTNIYADRRDKQNHRDSWGVSITWEALAIEKTLICRALHSRTQTHRYTYTYTHVHTRMDMYTVIRTHVRAHVSKAPQSSSLFRSAAVGFKKATVMNANLETLL